jgi:hypothetical protein
VTSLNEITALLALFMMSFVVIGFWPSFARKNTTPNAMMRRGVACFVGALMCRMMYWDVIIPLLRYLRPDAARWMIDAIGAGFNVTFNVAVIAAAWMVLRALFLTIPKHKRHLYNTFTCVFYPRQIIILRRSRKD